MTKDQVRRLGRFLREARRTKELTMRQVAESAGVGMSTVVHLERGDFAAPRLETIRALAVALDLPLSDIYALTGVSPPSDLPSIKPYLRSKYGELPDEAVDDMERYFARLAGQYGYQAQGPAHGEDES